MCLTHPHRGAAVLRVAGELDTLATPRLTEVLLPRLDSCLQTLVIDLSLSFLGTTALVQLRQACHRAQVRGISFWLVTGPRCVERILEVTGLRTQFPIAATVAEALHHDLQSTRKNTAPTAGGPAPPT